ncbi:hypothetical protein ECL_00085 [Enterobacter cloacae subsp. cloacae ATCC 13047]|uniref:Uncharacterized protein n=1 Tax=Enterobacter cloacae subsp. cloacae (strain ATCC 13047 / DSM 30054 / NBRC 13535 / NCTC 10005 / WDCM 00083 / NCDC 279-56) TaxID=716541 RepID=A0A0H3CCW4_ENTCC|nr:hypothetical protein ECL_00085 [Enterobacter cloacae subsp. cloacae ATCC 13047]
MPAVKANGGPGQAAANTQHRFRCHGMFLQSQYLKLTQSCLFVQVLAEVFFIAF